MTLAMKTAALVAATFSTAAIADSRPDWVFGFGTPSGGIDLKTPDVYDPTTGYGFEPDQTIHLADAQPANADASMRFSARVPEGNYRVRVTLSPKAGGSDAAVKAELRRVMVPLTPVAGDGVTVSFVVNVHTPRVDDRTSVSQSPREQTASLPNWDDKLTIEICGRHPAVSAITIAPAPADTKTVFLAGDSTVCDQPNEPWAAWGQLLPQFFGDGVVVANYAESGRSLRSFKAEHRWAKLLSQAKAGDWVLIQFGHNDMKETGPGVGAFTSFSQSLRQYVADVRAKGATPVLLTPMHRRKFSGDTVQPTFGDYPEATRKVASELSVPLIDLQAMSKPLYESFGPERSKLLFVHFPANAFAGQDKPLKDDTHFRAFGADQIARCVVQGIRDLKLPLAESLRPGIPTFDPGKPADPAAYDLPPSAAGTIAVPEGR